MKKLAAGFLLLAVAAGAVFLARQKGVVLPAALGGGDKAVLEKKSMRFIECLNFKDFRCAAAFHTEQDLKEKPDLPKMLENFFLIPPESLDVQDSRVDYVELDSTGSRAKVKTTTTVRILNKNETQKPEIMLYWKRLGDNWYLDLRTTLERGRGLP